MKAAGKPTHLGPNPDRRCLTSAILRKPVLQPDIAVNYTIDASKLRVPGIPKRLPKLVLTMLVGA